MTHSSAEPGTVRVYINARPLDVEGGITPLDALGRHDAAAAALVEEGARVIVDHRGLPVSPGDRVTNGSIFRVVSSKQAS